MRRRKWSLIFPIAAVAGYAVFGFWGAVVSPLLALAAYAWFNRRERGGAQRAEEERFAAFLQSVDAAPPVQESTSQAAPRAELPPPSRAVMASRAITLAVRATDVALALALFAEFSTLRDELTLEAATLNKLGLALLEHGAFLEAGWALHAAAIAAGDSVSAGKKLAEVAGKAAAAGRTRIAGMLYLELVERYPDASLANFAQARAEELRQQ